MKIVFIDHYRSESLASARYRINIPAKALQSLGLNVSICQELPEQADVVVFSKHFMPHQDQAMILEAKNKGIKSVFDVCDNHFVTEHQAHYRFMVQHADIVVVNSRVMRDVIRHHTGRESVIVDDPYEYAISPAKFAPQQTLKLLWYGHSSNLDTVNDLIKSIYQIKDRIRSDYHLSVKLQLMTNVPVVFPPNTDCEASIWSYEGQREAVDHADIITIPSVKTNMRKMTKSHNRVTEAIVAGRFVCANSLPAYEQFSEYAWIGDDIGEGILWALSHPNEVVDRIEQGQKYIVEHFSPEIIAQQWLNAFSGLS